MRFHHLILAPAALVAVALVTSESRAAELSTPPIAAQAANTFLTCAIQNAGGKNNSVRLQIVKIPDGALLDDTGEVTPRRGTGS
jgi:hypothetical protein